MAEEAHTTEQTRNLIEADEEVCIISISHSLSDIYLTTLL